MADPVNARNESLTRLSDADYEVASGEPDVRSWDVVLANGDKIGTVDDLIIDPSAGKVRYLDVDVDKTAAGIERDRHVLVPIASARLDTEDEEVLLGGMDRTTLLAMPEYDGDVASSTYDDTFRTRSHSDEVESKRMTRSAEELRIGKRTLQQGEMRASKRVETDHVRQSVPLEHEQVHVERRPVERGSGAGVDLRNDEIVVPVMSEEAVVEKRPVVKEEVVISKSKVTEPKTVEADVRHEEVDVQPSSEHVRVEGDTRKRGGE